MAQFLDDYAAGNPKAIKEMTEALLSADARGPGSGPAMGVLDNGRVQILGDIHEVGVPQKMRTAAQNDFDKLSSKQRLILKVV